jgi:hypothetical protein
MTDLWEMIWWFVQWLSVMHYIIGLRFLVVNAMRIIALFTDVGTQYNTYSVFEQTNTISLTHPLEYWDFFFEYMGYTINFGFYLPLTTIIEPKTMSKLSLAVAKVAIKKEKSQTMSGMESLN